MWWRNEFFCLQFPYVCGEGCAVSIGLFIEGIAVVVVSLFKGVRSQAYILLTLLLGGNCTLVDHVGGLAASLQHTAVSAAPAVAASYI